MIELTGFAIVSALSLVGVSLVRSLAWRANVLDVPNQRSSHSRPTPRGGGLPIAVLVLLVAAASILRAESPDSRLVGYLVGGIAIAAVGWRDDVRSLSSRVRFGVHSLAAVAIIVSAGFWSAPRLPIVGDVPLEYLGLVVTFLWVVGLTNAYNFMDGIDGIAGGQAAVAGVGWAVIGLILGTPAVVALGLAIAGSSLGFLRHNWPRASIFMGDVGSGFLGFTFASLAVVGASADSRLAYAGVLMVWPFVFDALFTFIRRARKGEDVFSAHRTHLYQRLVLAGRSHAFVSVVYIALAAVGVALAIWWLLDEWVGGLSSVVVVALLALLLWRFVTEREGSRAQLPARPDGVLTRGVEEVQ